MELAELERRMKRVRVLLRTKDAYVPAPPAQQLPTVSGPAPGSRVPCEGRHGRIEWPARCRDRLCPVCHGSGWRRRRDGDPYFDEYVNEPVVVDLAGTREAAAKPRKAKKHTGESYVQRFDLRARDRQDRRGSYRELRRALTLMRAQPALEPESRALWLIYESGLPYLDTPTLWLREYVAVEWLARIMRGGIWVPPEHLTADLAA